MAVTGQVFDLDPKTFTLGNMFAMQLHKYRDDIGKVTSAALKELTIENELRKLADTWKDQKFDMRKYQSVSVPLSACQSWIKISLHMTAIGPWQLSGHLSKAAHQYSGD